MPQKRAEIKLSVTSQNTLLTVTQMIIKDTSYILSNGFIIFTTYAIWTVMDVNCDLTGWRRYKTMRTSFYRPRPDGNNLEIIPVPLYLIRNEDNCKPKNYICTHYTMLRMIFHVSSVKLQQKHRAVSSLYCLHNRVNRMILFTVTFLQLSSLQFGSIGMDVEVSW